MLPQKGLEFRLIVFTVALIAIDQLGCLLIKNGTIWIGLPQFWEEGIEETLMFGSLLPTLVLSMDGIIWAPLFEELFFRGLLYVTLRTRLNPVPAALISGAFFGMAHLYSLAGFLQVFWTGIVLALAYERARSLWPCILAHSFNNLLAFGSTILLYR